MILISRNIDEIIINRSSNNTRRFIKTFLRHLNAATRAEPAQNNTRGTRAKRTGA